MLRLVRNSWENREVLSRAQPPWNELYFVVYNALRVTITPIWTVTHSILNRAHPCVHGRRQAVSFSEHSEIQLTSSNQNFPLLTNSRITVVKIATDVQIDEVTSLCKNQIIGIKHMDSVEIGGKNHVWSVQRDRQGSLRPQLQDGQKKASQK